VDVYLKSKQFLTQHNDSGNNHNSHTYSKIEFHADILEGDFKGLSVVVTKTFQPPVMNPLNKVKLDIGMIVQVSGNLSAHRPNDGEDGLTAFFRIHANAIERVRDIRDDKVRERGDIPDDLPEDLPTPLRDLLSNVKLLKDIELKQVDVYLKSACVWAFNEETGTNFKTDPCYKIEFHAGILEGKFKGLNVLITKIFKRPAINPFKDVQIDLGMVVQVSGKLSAQRKNNGEAGLTEYFLFDAEKLEREERYSIAREKNDNDCLRRNSMHTPNIFQYGTFSCK
jgi:hypothetical protein